MKQPDHRSLHELFTETTSGDLSACHQRAQQVDLLPPEQWRAEEAMLQALLEPPPLEKEELSRSNAESSLASFGLSWWRWPLGLTTAACLALFGTWLALPLASVDNPHELRPKGQASHTEQPRLMLQLGTWSPSQKQIEALKPGQTISPQHGVIFGFQLRKVQGYVYLFHKHKTQLKLIYPPAGSKPGLRKPKPQVQLLQQHGTPQQYTFDDERGQQEFILLLAKQPLSTTKLRQWNTQYRKQHDLDQSIRNAGLRAQILGSDRFHMAVRGSK